MVCGQDSNKPDYEQLYRPVQYNDRADTMNANVQLHYLFYLLYNRTRSTEHTHTKKNSYRALRHLTTATKAVFSSAIYDTAYNLTVDCGHR